MIDLKAVQRELAQARHARIEAQLAGCEVEELTDTLRQANAAAFHLPLHSGAVRRAPTPRLSVFSPP